MWIHIMGAYASMSQSAFDPWEGGMTTFLSVKPLCGQPARK
jgi:hypothetical protein